MVQLSGLQQARVPATSLLRSPKKRTRHPKHRRSQIAEVQAGSFRGVLRHYSNIPRRTVNTSCVVFGERQKPEQVEPMANAAEMNGCFATHQAAC